MPRFRFTVEFDAEDQADAEEQVEEANLSFNNIHTDKLEEVEGE